MDCLDASAGHANIYATPGRLQGDELLGCVNDVRKRFRPRAMTIASFDPSCAGSDVVSAAAIGALMAVLRAVEHRKSKSKGIQ